MATDMKEALTKAFQPEFVVTVEALGKRQGLEAIVKTVEAGLRGHDRLPAEYQDGKAVIFVRKRATHATREIYARYSPFDNGLNL